jgi:hypothetical protein
MYTARRKIQKDKGVEPSEFEDSVAQVSAEPYFAAFVIVSSLNSSVFFLSELLCAEIQVSVCDCDRAGCYLAGLL